MALQTRNLWMLVLGVQNNVPPNALQPRLPDGIHLRWAFDPARGFPWYGYYLFRRPSGEHREVCLGQGLRQYHVGPLNATTLAVAGFVVTSDSPLVLTDDFPAAGVPELSLLNRLRLTAALPTGQWAYAADVRIGFDKEDQRPTDGCAELDQLKDRQAPNPMTVEGVLFEAFDSTAQPLPGVDLAEFGGWPVSESTRITLPRPSIEVEIELTASGPVVIVAYDADGMVVDQVMVTGQGSQSVSLSGDGIVSLVLRGHGAKAALRRVCWKSGAEREKVRLRVRGMFGGAPVTQAVVTGAPGDVVSVRLASPAMDAISVDGGPAALIDLCVYIGDQKIGGRETGWQPVKSAGRQPISLPVDHPDYPCSTHPGSAADAESLALGRISYGPAASWGGGPFADVHGQLEALVVGGPAGPAMADRSSPVPGSPAPPPGVTGSFAQRGQRPLDLLTVGALNPAIAQQLGLYVVDRDVTPGTSYDYLLLADFDNTLGGTAGTALAWLAAPDFSSVDGFLALGVTMGPDPGLPAPTELRSYALPGSTVQLAAGGELNATSNTGLTWNRRTLGNALEPGAPVLYHVWRADLGDGDDPAAPDPGAFSVLTADRAVPVTRPGASAGTAPQPADWPPMTLHFLDRGLAEGWYAYQINGVDLFGRHSTFSDAAQWWQWAPRPDPRPWYYLDPATDQQIDATRIRLLDKVPPPPPTGVEAFALDRADPTVLHDGAWAAWQAGLGAAERADGELIGLRVRWRWPVAAQLQAPDMREFRIYYSAAPVNSLVGRVVAVAPATTGQSTVQTDITGTFADGDFTGLWLRVGTDSFRVTASAAASPLSLTVGDIGPAGDRAPLARSGCVLALPPDHPSFVDQAPATAWQTRRLTVDYSDVTSVDAAGNRRYEVFLPGAGDPLRSGAPLSTSLVEPVAYGLVGVSAADARTHTPDLRGDAARWGNESRVGGPATVFRVRRVPPPAPVPPPDSEKVFASPADYAGHSFYTARWIPADHLRTHVFRGLDDAVFAADALLRPRPALSGTETDTYPPEWPALKRSTVAGELNHLNTANLSTPDGIRAAYSGLSNDGLRVLAALPGTEKAFTQVTSQPLDPDEPDATSPDGLTWRRTGPDVAAGSLPAGQRAFVDTLDGRTRSRWFYRSAQVDGVHNRGRLSLSSAPVWLPAVVPPRAPVPHSVIGGEQRITLSWASNREPDLVEYRILRGADAGADVRLMTQVGRVAVAAGDPALRPTAVSWSDDPVPGLVTMHYRLLAVDEAGNVSLPSPPLAGRAHDTALPLVPALSAGWTTLSGRPAAEVSWTATDNTLLERQTTDDVVWTPVGDWRDPGPHDETFPLPDTVSWRLRLRARRYTGALTIGASTTLDHR